MELRAHRDGAPLGFADLTVSLLAVTGVSALWFHACRRRPAVHHRLSAYSGDPGARIVIDETNDVDVCAVRKVANEFTNSA